MGAATPRAPPLSEFDLIAYRVSFGIGVQEKMTGLKFVLQYV